ncbi:MAG: tetratricopeptide repeat protein [Bacteroidales bacterium]|nr:tetratricopeptide repeat protein [Bacteroidales bacterium]
MFKKVTTIFTIIFYACALNVAAQSAEEAYELYQNGIKAVETKDYETAINELSASLTMYEKMSDLEGIEGAETVIESAKQALAQTYYAYGMELYQEKNFDKALLRFKDAEECAKNSDNDDIATKASNYVGRVYISKASATFTDKQYDETIAAADAVLKMESENETAYFWRGRAYKEKGDLNKMKADLDKCMELTQGDEQKATTYANAAKIASSAYMSAGTDAIKNKKYTEAITHLETAASYPESNANIYYYMASAYNLLSKWNDAITAANKALSMELKDPSATYYELGKAYEGLGKKSDACTAYKKVTAEQYKKVAEYQMQTVLKCN